MEPTLTESRDRNYINILKSELIPALGCTEPIAIAYAAAMSRHILGVFPERLELYCSGNIIKNVKGVTVPNSGGMKGIDVAGVLGVVCGRYDKALEVLEGAAEADIQKTKELIADGFVTCMIQEGVENLYVRAVTYHSTHRAEVTIEKRHTFISEIKKDGTVIYHDDPQETASHETDKSKLTIAEIIDFANTVDINLVKDILDEQILYNTNISNEGLKHSYGAEIGRILLKTEGDAVGVRAKAKAAAGSDARMGGCSLPVVINSGSGNQGITVSVPVIEYAREYGIDETGLYRALIVSNLVSIHLKYYIGSLSAFCGAVSAASGAGAAITYMFGGSPEQIAMTIINTLANTSGIVCDGAKSSCAAKIASSVEAAILGHNMSMNGIRFHSGDGLVQEDAEDTIQNIGFLGRVGMKETDLTILKLMLGQIDCKGGECNEVSLD